MRLSAIYSRTKSGFWSEIMNLTFVQTWIMPYLKGRIVMNSWISCIGEIHKIFQVFTLFFFFLNLDSLCNRRKDKSNYDFGQTNKLIDVDSTLTFWVPCYSFLVVQMSKRLHVCFFFFNLDPTVTTTNLQANIYIIHLNETQIKK